MLADTLAISERDVIMPVVPMFHANAWGLAHAGVMAGSAFAFPGPQMTPAAIAKLMEDEQVTLAAGVPTIWMGALDELEGRDISSLRAIVCGGSAVPKALSEAYREQLGQPILHAWGMTETSPLGSVCRVKSTLLEKPEDELADVRATQGIVTPLVECRIVEPGTRATSCPGTARRAASCRSPARGWRPATTTTRRAPQPFTDDGWLRTGDVATISPDGYIRLVDRTKDLVKSGGEWISSVELENEIMAHPSVREAAVIGVPRREVGRAAAGVRSGRGQRASWTPTGLREFLSDRVAKWWIPRAGRVHRRGPQDVGRQVLEEVTARTIRYLTA